jgi:putative DNA primase/helicase
MNAIPTDFNDLARLEGLAAVAADVENAQPVIELAMWPDPVLPGALHTPTIPADVLPSWLGAMAGAIAQSTQTPPALAVMSCLAVLATVLQRNFEVAPHGDHTGYTEPLSLWTLGAAASGSRKTAVQMEALAPLVYWEKLKRDQARRDIARAFATRKVAEKRIERLMHDASKAKSDEEREALRAEIQREQEDMPAEVFAPRLWTGDTTAERLQGLLVEQNERMAVHTDEAGIFGIMSGRYNKGQANLDVFLQGHSGKAIRVDRSGRVAHIDKPALSFGLLLQPGLLSDAAGSSSFRDSGLLARFLFVIPESNVGRRDVRRNDPIPAEVRHAYQAELHQLLDGLPAGVRAPRVISLSAAARERWYDLAAVIERHQGEGGKFESISDWTCKLPGAAARIACLLELAVAGVEAPAVSDASMARAVRLAELLIPHAQAAFGMLGADQPETDALAILKWVRGLDCTDFTTRECQRAMNGRFNDGDRMKKALLVLKDRDVLQSFTIKNECARPSAAFRVNPKALSR